MAQTVINTLYKEFFNNGSAATDARQASAHWKDFSKHFSVSVDADENLLSVSGYGFGGSGNHDLNARVSATIGNAVMLTHLACKGLSGEIKRAKKLVATMGLSFSQDACRQVCTKYFLQKQIEKSKTLVNNILLIGDGHGILSALMHEQYPNAKIFLIDLGATLFFQAYHLGKKYPKAKHVLVGEVGNEEGDFIYCPAEQVAHFPLTAIDLAINIASMQEMTPDVINQYFKMLRERKTGLFYCCNRLEKKLPDGQVIRFMEYPWTKEDKHLADEKCPWHQFFFGRSGSENVKLMNILPIPFFHKYDGVHWHRLTLLSH
jgi:putative sugar O-methyltransferase